MNQEDLIPHLFRVEFSKICSVLARHFGMAHVETAEDITGETFLAALENWPYNGIPENPTAWLYTVAKNKAINYHNRNRIFIQRVGQELMYSDSQVWQPEPDLSEQNISDSQLHMLFAICHPCIPAEAQVGLALRILCGFGIEEIAVAFLTNKETINKRLYRAKEKLRQEKVDIRMPGGSDLHSRLDAVLATLYLLFTEGYYSECHDNVIREELCQEAMRLIGMLLENEITNLPAVHALYALMNFQASRFSARKNGHGELILYDDQDETLWNAGMIATGAYHLHQASRGGVVTSYHLEAAIAYWHTHKTDSSEKWQSILQLYDHLLQIAYSPVAALNRIMALSKISGREIALAEAEKLQLTGNHYYHILVGELCKDHDREKSRQHFELALSLARTQPDKLTAWKRLNDNSILPPR